MNAPFHSEAAGAPPRRGFLTQAADGQPRRGFTNQDVRRMIEHGVIDEDERIELIKGELVPMGSEHDLHGRARALLTRLFVGALGHEWFVATNLSLYLAEDIEFQPDLHVFPAKLKSQDVRGPDVLIAVELSSTTQKKDKELKAPLYGAHGVRELWVIDLEARTGLVFEADASGAYGPGRPVTEHDALTPKAFEHITLSITDLY
jgi:Uma2 family endonuclease